jgi:hypothetical protein
MATYRIRLQGYVDWIGEGDEPPPNTPATILEALWDMELSIGDIEDLQLSIQPLTPTEEADEARKMEERLAHARAIGEQLRRERDGGRTP